MQIRKTYTEVNPELLFNEIRDFVLKQGTNLGEAKIETYASPSDTSSFISRGTLSFNLPGESGKEGKECIRAHIVGSVRTETKMMLDTDEKLFPPKKTSALQDDLDFIFGPFEKK
ncbi:MAG: hypothetical protein CL874_03975 [Dehalococcoidales bacterium]|jgi:hypothetical protein|nr:hypothetical protein [Dehalococcoidales bacterium]MDP6576222.1 hypothetical protein [Dehalococcoidales bacterium]|tara:strand:+ start:468 stop:812 length:345 start_codon:yes stop_codon:yes gene_type:complete